MDVPPLNTHPSNFKFITLLNSSPFSDEERHNIYTIFSVLRDQRKIDILGHWGEHLEKLLSVKIQIESERQALVHDTFTRIVREIDSVYLRNKEEEERIMKESKQHQEDVIAAMDYDAQKRKKQILQVRYIETQEREKINDPLSIFL